jgi:hypothetical protein
LLAEDAAEIDAPDGSVFADEHVGEVGIGVADKLGGHSSGWIVRVRRVRHYEIDLAVGFCAKACSGTERRTVTTCAPRAAN